MMHPVVVLAFFSFGGVSTVEDSKYVQMPDLFGLDDYESCLKDKKGVYCVAKFNLFSDPGNDLIKLIKEHSEDRIKHYNYSYVERGICVTRTCKQYIHNNNVKKTSDLTELLEKCFNKIIWDQYKINASLSKGYYCNRHGEHVKLDTIDWVVAALLGVLAGLSLIGSYYDIRIRKRNENNSKAKGNKYLLCFSIFQNLQTLTSDEKKLSEDTRMGLHSIRTIALGLVVYAHMSISIFIYNKDPHAIEKMYDSAICYLTLNGMTMVQIFFFLSGFLLAYILQVRSERSIIKWSTIPKIIVMRWFRLTPACVVMIAVMVSWARHLGSGPLWNMAMTLGPTAQCRTFWWSHILFINNMLPDNKLCVFQTWHTAADMQMFILGLVVHVATRSRGRILVLSLLLFLGMLAPAVPIWLYGYDAFQMAVPEYVRTLSHEMYHYVHIRSYMNLPCFVLGMATGYLGLRLQNRGTDLSKHTTLRFLSWWIVPLFFMVIYSGRPFYTTELRASVLARMGYAVTHRAVLGLLCAAWVLGLICRCNDVSSRLLTWRGWVVTSKLCYCVYIIHIIFLHLFLGLRRQLTEDSLLDMIPLTFGVLVASYVFAVPLYLMVEAPFQKIIKTVWEGQFENKKNV